MASNHYQQLGSYLRIMRRMKKKSMKDISDHIGFSRMHVSRIERGTQKTTLENIEQLLNLYGYSFRVTIVKLRERIPQQVFWADKPEPKEVPEVQQPEEKDDRPVKW